MTVGDVRQAVIFRDGQCVAPVLDPKAGACYDRWGKILSVGAPEFEMDYVRRGAQGNRHELVEDHVTGCAGHHRGSGPNGGAQWNTSHRELLREYLDVCNDVPSEQRVVRGWGLRAWRKYMKGDAGGVAAAAEHTPPFAEGEDAVSER